MGMPVDKSCHLHRFPWVRKITTPPLPHTHTHLLFSSVSQLPAHICEMCLSCLLRYSDRAVSRCAALFRFISWHGPEVLGAGIPHHPSAWPTCSWSQYKRPNMLPAPPRLFQLLKRGAFLWSNRSFPFPSTLTQTWRKTLRHTPQQEMADFRLIVGNGDYITMTFSSFGMAACHWESASPTRISASVCIVWRDEQDFETERHTEKCNPGYEFACHIPAIPAFLLTNQSAVRNKVPCSKADL